MFAHQQPTSNIQITFTALALTVIEKHSASTPKLRQLIEQVLSQDPRPAYKQKQTDDKVYGMSLYQFNIQWQFDDSHSIKVISVEANNS